MKSDKCVLSTSCDNHTIVIVPDNWNGKGVGANEGQAEDRQIVDGEIWWEGGWMESEWAIPIPDEVRDAHRWPAAVAVLYQGTCDGMACLFSQNKVEEAERKKRQSQEELDGITQQLSVLQSTCSELKAKVQKQNAMFKSREVSVGMKPEYLIGIHTVQGKQFNCFYFGETQKYPVNRTINILHFTF